LNSNNFDFDFNNNGNDIRFTDENGNLLDYYVEKMDLVNKEAIIWVKVPSIPANSTVYIYMYYKSCAPSKSDPYKVFDYYCDFSRKREAWSETLGSKPIRPYPRALVDEKHSGYLNHIGDIYSPATIWEYDVGEEVRVVLADDVDNDGELEVIAFSTTKITCINWKGDTTKWTYTLPSGEEWHMGTGSFVIDDIDNDGIKEIVAFTYITHETNGYIRCINASNGQEKWNYYCNKGDTTTGSDANGMEVADIDGDGLKEIICLLDINGELLVLNADGTKKWSATDASEYEYGAVAVDVDGDGNVEIITGSESDGVLMYDHLGNLIKQYSNPASTYCSCNPSVADIDGDGKLEILCGFDWVGSGGKSVVCLDDNLTELWSVEKGDCDLNAGVLYDIDNDGKIEYIRGCSDGNIYCFDAQTGTIKWSYATGDQCQYCRQLAVDIDNDGNTEILSTSLDGFLYCLDNAGNLKWKVSCNPQTRVFAVADLNRDGFVEVIVPTSTGVRVVASDKYVLATIDNGSGTIDWDYTTDKRLEYTNYGGGIDDWVAKEVNATYDFVLQFEHNSTGDAADLGVGFQDQTVEFYSPPPPNNAIIACYDTYYNVPRLVLIENGTKRVVNGTASITEGTTYYFSLIKLGTTIRMEIYSDPERTNLVDSVETTFDGDLSAAVKYLMLLTNGEASGYTASGWIDNVILRKYTEPEPLVEIVEIE